MFRKSRRPWQGRKRLGVKLPNGRIRECVEPVGVYSPVLLIFDILPHSKRSPTRPRVGPQAARGRALEQKL